MEQKNRKNEKNSSLLRSSLKCTQFNGKIINSTLSLNILVALGIAFRLLMKTVVMNESQFQINNTRTNYSLKRKVAFVAH